MPKQALYSIKANTAFCTKAAFPNGDTFHFWGIPGSRPRSQYIFLVHNHQLWISFSLILYTFCTTISTKIPISFNHHNLSPINSICPFYLFLPGVHFSLTKISKKYIPIPFPTYAPESLTFPYIAAKNSLKSLFFNR